MINSKLNLLMLAVLTLSGLPSAYAAEMPVAPVVVDHVRQDSAQAGQSATATVHSRQELRVRAGVAGRLEWVREAGERVARGDALARIDVVPLTLQREEQLARIHRNEVQLANLASRLARFSELQASNYYSVVELDDLRAQRDLAKADLEIARVQVRQLDDQIARATVVAPFEGLVTEQFRYPGEEVARGEDLAQVFNVGDIELRAVLPLDWLPGLAVGDVLEVRRGAEAAVLGTIRRLIPNADARSQTFEARVDLPASVQPSWVVGQLAAVRLPAALLARALMVPRDALVLRRDATYVFHIDDSEHAQRVPVELGAGRGEWIVVSGALSEGDRVVVRGAERLAPGQMVEVVRDLANSPAGATS